jgi:uncharacterized protein YjbI with pentapeptide repeats
MAEVFISYARSDGDAAERLVKALRAINVTGWRDTADVAAGTSIAASVRDALDKSSAVIVLLSPRALHSEWVQFEIGAAESLRKKIIPVVVSGEDLEQQFPEILKNIAWIDARGRSEGDVTKELEHALAGTSSGTSSAVGDLRKLERDKFVADNAQVQLLGSKDIKAWNAWLKANPDTRPNLRAANLTQADLRDANLNRADLIGANLSQADLRGADLGMADLTQANLWRADLYGAQLSDANLSFADLSWTNLSFANLERANLKEASLVGSNLRETILNEANFGEVLLVATNFANVDLSSSKNLETIRHVGPSEISISTIYRSGGNIPEEFLRGAGVPEFLVLQIKSLAAAPSPIEFYSCFISYSSKDQKFAERLHADLQSNNVRCWFAPADLKLGDKLRTSFDEAIRSSDKLVVLLSENSVISPWVEKEVETAFKKERREKRTVLFPIRLDDAAMETSEAWAADIRRTRHIGDFRDWKNHDLYKKAFDRLLRNLKA